MTATLESRTRRRLVVRGAVQGVGFRPFVFKLATELGLTGWVNNTPAGVMIDIEGTPESMDAFHDRLQREPPPRAAIHCVEQAVLAPVGFAAFTIRESSGHGEITTPILPDIAVCGECLSETFDPADRRYRYPFTNCTDCGPRFSIIEALPYDRANTSMKRFVLCAACQREYDDPTDRRFHAQPNACPDCGPRLELRDAQGRPRHTHDRALRAAIEALRNGGILALKGLGGFQLLVDARNEDALAELRRRKRREDKPFALMVASLSEAEKLCDVHEEERRLLQSSPAPIVLLRRREDAGVRIGRDVAPRDPYLGVVLPYTPLHHLMMRELGFPVVATSGNRSDEPICIDEDEALIRLKNIADLFLVHNRPIIRHVDDSVVRIIAQQEMMLRRARGYAPFPIPVEKIDEAILAVGGHQKNTVALAFGGQAFISQHIGDLVTEQAFDSFHRTLTDLPRLYDAQPCIVACDLHPDYLSTKHAERTGSEIVRVQHHHAHIVSCMAENDVDGTVLGVAWDGAGYGTDGTIWGGEFLLCDRSNFDRVAHLRPFALPGGDLAAHEPRRSALGLLHEVYKDALFDQRDWPVIQAFCPSELRVLRGVLKRRVNCPTTSSVGRLFDAVASILGIRQRTCNEGQAAMELEFAAEGSDCSDAYRFEVENASPNVGRFGHAASPPRIINWATMIAAIIDEAGSGKSTSVIARKFHNTLVEMIATIAHHGGQERVVLSGGCFQNRLLTERAISRLAFDGYQPYWHHGVPPNDGGVALGQAVVAQQRAKERARCV